MGKITLQSALNNFTQLVISALVERKAPTAAFGTYFTELVSGAKEVSWEIKRSGRPVAVDISHHEHGITTKSNKSTQKIYVPPYYDYNTNIDALDSFERAFDGSPYVDVPQYDRLIQETATDMQLNMDRIERAEELQRAQALLTGILVLKNGDNIDFNRDAASIVAYDNAHAWDNSNINPGLILTQGAGFLVTKGNADPGQIFDVILGSDAMNALRDHPLFQKDLDVRNYHYGDLTTGVVARNGMTPQGSWSRGNYRFNFWGYEGYYDSADGTQTLKYMDSKSIIILPSVTDFKMFYGGTKAWRGTGMSRFPTIIKAKRNFYSVDDELNVSKLMGVRTAPVALLRSIDSVFTAVVVANAQQG